VNGTVKTTSFRKALLDTEQVQQTILRLVEHGTLSETRGALLRQRLPDMVRECGYIIGHLGAHLGIGAVRSIMIALPLGSLLRCSWVAGSRVYETPRWNPEKARIQSLLVFLIAAISFAGYFSRYLGAEIRRATAMVWGWHPDSCQIPALFDATLLSDVYAPATARDGADDGARAVPVG